MKGWLRVVFLTIAVPQAALPIGCCSLFLFFSSLHATHRPPSVMNVRGIAVARKSHQFLAKWSLFDSSDKPVKFIPKNVWTTPVSNDQT